MKFSAAILTVICLFLGFSLCAFAVYKRRAVMNEMQNSLVDSHSFSNSSSSFDYAADSHSISELRITVADVAYSAGLEQLVVTVAIEKPQGKSFLVDSVNTASTLTWNGNPVRSAINDEGKQLHLRKAPYSVNVVLRYEASSPHEGDMFQLKWTNRIPNTRDIETLESEPFAYMAMEGSPKP